VRDRVVAVLGFAFKPGSDDIRDSPALAVATSLSVAGAIIRVHDPCAALPDELAGSMTVAATPRDAVTGAEAVLHLTEWPEYRELDPSELAQIATARVLLDARNCLDKAAWRSAGWQVRGLGVP
jgi:UDPglucose 6-dehydrogenase